MMSISTTRRPLGGRALGFAIAVGLVAAGALVAPGVPSAAAATQQTFYVSTTGNDSNTGLSSGSPFATIERAQQEVRTINTDMTGDIVVNIAAGDYFIPDTITFDEDDKGTNGFYVKYVASDGPGTSRLIGGKRVTSSWTLVNRTSPATPADADQPAAADGKVYKTNVAALLGTDRDINSLFVDDNRATMARTPNRAPDARFAAHNGAYATTEWADLASFKYRVGEIDATSLQGLRNAVTRNDLDAQFYIWERGYKDWMTSTIPIGSVNETTRIIAAESVPGHDELNRPHWALGGGGLTSGARYFLQGNLGFLDQPGEYYLNKSSGDLYYYPHAASDLTQKQIVLPTTETVIELEGASRTNQVSNIVFDGLQVGSTNFPSYYSYGWNAFDDMSPIGRFCPESAGSAMPSYCEFTERQQFKVGAITARNATDIEITRAHITNAGLFGVGIFEGADHITVSNSVIENAGHSGVLIDGGYPRLDGDEQGNSYTNNNTVTNSVIRDVGRLAGGVSGVSIRNSGYNTVSHSEISGSPRSLLNLTTGWPRKPSVAFPDGDGDFDRMKHVYAHHNTFEYLYLHNGQQDGGDDGSIFGAMLYFGPTNHRPNTINQVVIDKIAAHPSMKDIAPNGMNLDMGAAGFTVSNFKAINPQHYNVQDESVKVNNDEVHFDNTNINFGVVTNQLAEFDDSEMEYDQIGVDQTTFPAAYLTLTDPGFHDLPAISGAWFSDDFDQQKGIDVTKWRFSGSEPRLTAEYSAEGSEGVHRALEIDSDSSPAGQKPVVTRTFSAAVNKVVTMRFFDRENRSLAPYTSGMPISTTLTAIPRVDKGDANVVGVGLDTSVSTSRYVTQLGSTVAATSVPRSYGWHELKWDYSNGTDVKVSIDGVQVATTATTGFSQIQLGMANGKGVSYYDRVVVEAGGQGGTAPALSSIPTNLSPYATPTSSSEYVPPASPWIANYSPWTVTDGLVGKTGYGEWAVASADAARWVQLTWATPQLLNRVVLADRANTSDQVTRGRLVFSDGSTEPVVALPDAGGRFTVDFIPRSVTSVKFEITASRGLPGLSEFETYGPASVTASTFYTNPVNGQQFSPAKAVDGIIGQWGPGEWAVDSGDTTDGTDPWIQLDWPVSRPLNQVVLYDRPNLFDQVTSGILRFSDGSSITVGALDNAGAPLFVKFPDKNVTWVKFEITGSQGLPGLSEIRTESAPALARVATPTVSSQYNANYSANALNDGVIGVWGSGEWATAGPSDTAPWARLTWPSTVNLTTVVLYDRPNTVDQITGGTLVFSDGSTVAVTALPNDGSAKTVSVGSKNVTWVTFEVTSSTGLPGLSEIEVN